MKRVIVAEPNVNILNHLVTALKQYNEVAVVSTAENGKELLEKIKTYKPDIVITDEEMKELKGTEVLENVQSYEYKPKFIFVTATYLPEIYQKLLKYKVRRYFIKPFETSKLIDEILEKSTISESGFRYKNNNSSLINRIKQKLKCT